MLMNERKHPYYSIVVEEKTGSTVQLKNTHCAKRRFRFNEIVHQRENSSRGHDGFSTGR